MRISVIYPPKGVHPDNKNWMHFVFKELDKYHDVLFNVCDDDCEVILGMSISQKEKIRRATKDHPHIPLITYNWDMHPLLQPEVGDWRKNGWKKLLEESIDIWTQTDYHADLSKEITGLDHFVMPICGLDFEFEGVDTKDVGYAMMASRRVPYKGFELFEEGCKKAGIESVSRHPDYDNREDYIEQLSRCKVLVVASEEEANTPMSAYEAAFLGKPLLLSDIPPHREEWGDTVTYFKNKDIDSFVEQLRNINDGSESQKRAMEMFTVKAFVDRINKRLCEVLS